MIMEILDVIRANLENAVLDAGKNTFQKKKLEKDFLTETKERKILFYRTDAVKITQGKYM